jgi:hypothetical protein
LRRPSTIALTVRAMPSVLGPVLAPPCMRQLYDKQRPQVSKYQNGLALRPCRLCLPGGLARLHGEAVDASSQRRQPVENLDEEAKNIIELLFGNQVPTDRIVRASAIP